jgi:hypothetical protein
MLVEQDNATDISGAEVISAWRAQLALVWQAQMFALLAGGAGPATEAQRAAAGQAMVNAMQGLASLYMEFPKGNDDLIDAPKRVKVFPDQFTARNFYGDGGHYTVRFKIA